MYVFLHEAGVAIMPNYLPIITEKTAKMPFPDGFPNNMRFFF